jgi:hypothetical protein
MTEKEPNKYSAENGYLSIHEVLGLHGRKQRHMVEQLKREDFLDERESYDQIANDIKSSRVTTDMDKEAFIQEIMGDLGEEIKTSPGITVRKKSLGERIKTSLIKFFTRF